MLQTLFLAKYRVHNEDSFSPPLLRCVDGAPRPSQGEIILGIGHEGDQLLVVTASTISNRDIQKSSVGDPSVWLSIGLFEEPDLSQGNEGDIMLMRVTNTDKLRGGTTVDEGLGLHSINCRLYDQMREL